MRTKKFRALFGVMLIIAMAFSTNLSARTEYGDDDGPSDCEPVLDVVTETMITYRDAKNRWLQFGCKGKCSSICKLQVIELPE